MLIIVIGGDFMPLNNQLGGPREDKKSEAQAKGKLDKGYMTAVLENANNFFKEFSTKGRNVFKSFSNKNSD